MPVDQRVRPFRAERGPVGVLVCHGFTGSPASVRPWAEHLAAAGLTVDVPLLAGHGTHWRDLAVTRWPDWYASVERSFAWLTERCTTVVAMGLSMGGTLVTRLAAAHGAGSRRVDGLVLVNPSFRGDNGLLRLLPVAKHLVPTVRSIGNDIAKPGPDEVAYPRVPLVAVDSLTELWQVVRDQLPRATQPTLLMRSLEDGVVGPSSAQVLLRSIGSDDVTVVPLRRSRHVATLDHDAALIHERSLDFVRRLAQRAAPAVASRPETSE